MYSEAEINLIILSSLDLPYKVKRLLLDGLNKAEPDFESHKNLLIKTLSCGIYNKVKANFSDPAYRDGILRGLEKRGIVCVTYFSDGYPQTLKNIDDPPINLYCKGDISLLKSNCFTVVGTRKSTPKMKEDCREIAGGICKAFTLVSGLAEGADAYALEGALEAGGKVISVIPNGFDSVYPAVNAPLLKRIEKSGLVITEYTPETTAKSYHFAVRNRILAGLSRGTLVTAAGERSGALITANYAADFGRDVFAFPHSLGVNLGKGCNGLLKNGAYLVENILDIFGKYGLDFKKSQKAELTDSERAVYNTLKDFGEVHMSALVSCTGKPLSEIIVILSSLEIKNFAKNLGGNRYCAK